MKSFFKRSAISMIVLGITGSAYAVVPNNSYNWSPMYSGVFLGVEGLYLQPRNGDLDYVTLFPTVAGGAFTTKNIDPEYDWAWRVYGGIKFTENDDITLSWMQLKGSDNNSVFPEGSSTGIASNPRFHFFDDIWDSIHGHVSFDLDDAYIVWGHTIHFSNPCNPWTVRYAAGVEYARIDSDLRVTEFNNDPVEGFPTEIGYKADSNLKGVGPRVEFDMMYGLGYGFNAFANFNAALLVSSRDISLTPVVATVTDFEGDETLDFFTSDFSKRHVVVPKFGARLGLGYTYLFGQCGGEGSATALTVNLGWQVESYVHAIERPDEGFADDTIIIPPGLRQGPVTVDNAAFATTKTSNFGDQGPFLGVQISTGWL